MIEGPSSSTLLTYFKSPTGLWLSTQRNRIPISRLPLSPNSIQLSQTLTKSLKSSTLSLVIVPILQSSSQEILSLQQTGSFLHCLLYFVETPFPIPKPHLLLRDSSQLQVANAKFVKRAILHPLFIPLTSQTEDSPFQNQPHARPRMLCMSSLVHVACNMLARLVNLDQDGQTTRVM